MYFLIGFGFKLDFKTIVGGFLFSENKGFY